MSKIAASWNVNLFFFFTFYGAQMAEEEGSCLSYYFSFGLNHRNSRFAVDFERDQTYVSFYRFTQAYRTRTIGVNEFDLKLHEKGIEVNLFITTPIKTLGFFLLVLFSLNQPLYIKSSKL